MKSHQIEYWSHLNDRKLVNILSVKDTYQTPILIINEKKLKSVSNKWYNNSYDNSGNDNWYS